MQITSTQAAFLAVKIKSLAAEAAIIRKGERRHHATHKEADVKAETLLARAKADDSPVPDVSNVTSRSSRARQTWLGLKEHRRSVVRPEARASLLAYGYLRGVPYHVMEASCHLPPDWARVANVASRFGTERVSADALVAWSKLRPEAAAAA